MKSITLRLKKRINGWCQLKLNHFLQILGFFIYSTYDGVVFLHSHLNDEKLMLGRHNCTPYPNTLL